MKKGTTTPFWQFLGNANFARLDPFSTAEIFAAAESRAGRSPSVE